MLLLVVKYTRQMRHQRITLLYFYYNASVTAQEELLDLIRPSQGDVVSVDYITQTFPYIFEG